MPDVHCYYSYTDGKYCCYRCYYYDTVLWFILRLFFACLGTSPPPPLCYHYFYYYYCCVLLEVVRGLFWLHACVCVCVLCWKIIGGGGVVLIRPGYCVACGKRYSSILWYEGVVRHERGRDAVFLARFHDHARYHPMCRHFCRHFCTVQIFVSNIMKKKYNVPSDKCSLSKNKSCSFLLKTVQMLAFCGIILGGGGGGIFSLPSFFVIMSVLLFVK